MIPNGQQAYAPGLINQQEEKRSTARKWAGRIALTSALVALAPLVLVTAPVWIPVSYALMSNRREPGLTERQRQAHYDQMRGVPRTMNTVSNGVPVIPVSAYGLPIVPYPAHSAPPQFYQQMQCVPQRDALHTGYLLKPRG